MVISFDGNASDALRDPGSIPHGSRTKDDWTTTTYTHPFDFWRSIACSEPLSIVPTRVESNATAAQT